MTLTQGQIDVLKDFGVRCCNCGELATRKQLARDIADKRFCTWGPLSCQVPLQNTSVSNKVLQEWYSTHFLGRIEEHFEEAKEDPIRVLGSYAHAHFYRVPYYPEFCDSCGDPNMDYADLLTAHLIREIPKDLPPEPVQKAPSILERLLEK